MRKASQALGITLISLTLLTTVGCWDNRELDTISIVTGVGIDTSQQPEEIDFTAQVGKAIQGGSSQQDKPDESGSFLIIEATKRGVLSAIDFLQTENSRTPFLHHNQVIIFGREQAEKGIKPHLDIFMRQHEMRMEVWILVADERAKDILSISIEPEKISAITLSRMLENETRESKYLGTTLMDFTVRLIEATTSPVAPIVKITHEGEFPKLALSGMAVFKKDKLVGQLTNGQIKGYLWTMGDLMEQTVEVFTDSGYANLDVSNITCKIQPILQGGGQASVALQIEGRMTIEELQGFQGMKLSELMPFLEQAVKNQITKEIRDCFATTQQLNTDIFGFGSAFHRKYPREWKSMEPRWDQIYPTMEIAIDIRIRLMDTGKISASLSMEEG